MSEFLSTFLNEGEAIKWGLIILGFASLVLLFRIPRVVGTPLCIAALMLLFGLEIYFFTQTDGLTFLSTGSVGWLWAIIWSLCFSLFLLIQGLIFAYTLKDVAAWAPDAERECNRNDENPAPVIVKHSLLAPPLGMLALGITMLIPPLNPHQNMFFIILLGIQALNLAVILFFAIRELGAVSAVYGVLFAPGIDAFCFMAREAFFAGLVILISFLFYRLLSMTGHMTQEEIRDWKAD